MTTAFQSNAFQNDAFQIDAGTGNNQALAITLDDVTVSVSQALEHSQTLATTLDSITTSIAQTNVHSQSLSATLDSVTFAANQTLSHAQSMAITLDSIDTIINQSVASASKDQSLAITLDDVSVLVDQIGRQAQAPSGVGSSSRNKRKFIQINNQNIWFNNPDEIYAILEKVKERIPELAKQQAVKIKTVGQARQVKPPTIQVNYNNLYDFADIKRNIDRLNAKIEKTYRDALIREAQRNAEDEEILIALLMD